VRAARIVLTPSNAAAGDVERLLGIPRERIRVTPEAAGAEYRPAPDPGDPALVAVARRFGVRGRYVFNVGGMDVRKNLPVLLEAFARALPRLEEPAQLVIAGAPHTGNRVVFPPLEPVIDRLGLGDHVVLTGFVSAADKLALYQGAALYATPSPHEGFGLTPLEAMACGVPVIAADRTSLPEVVGDAGVLVEPEPEAFAAAVVEVLNRPERAADLRARGLARAATFSWARTARMTLDAYREALG
jgi:glycosyltransferase involved in cell wall biosynthesis